MNAMSKRRDVEEEKKTTQQRDTEKTLRFFRALDYSVHDESVFAHLYNERNFFSRE